MLLQYDEKWENKEDREGEEEEKGEEDIPPTLGFYIQAIYNMYNILPGLRAYCMFDYARLTELSEVLEVIEEQELEINLNHKVYQIIFGLKYDIKRGVQIAIDYMSPHIGNKIIHSGILKIDIHF